MAVSIVRHPAILQPELRPSRLDILQLACPVNRGPSFSRSRTTPDVGRGWAQAIVDAAGWRWAGGDRRGGAGGAPSVRLRLRHHGRGWHSLSDWRETVCACQRAGTVRSSYECPTITCAGWPRASSALARRIVRTLHGKSTTSSTRCSVLKLDLETVASQHSPRQHRGAMRSSPSGGTTVLLRFPPRGQWRVSSSRSDHARFQTAESPEESGNSQQK
jgi:hypothetical protein